MSPTQYRKMIFVAVLLLMSPGSSIAQTDDPQLGQLRRQLALRYMEPGVHLQLAKYYLQKGDRLQAFYISEYARRTFPKPQFNQAFQTRFGGRNATVSKFAEALLYKAKELDQSGDIKAAEEYFTKAAEQSPGSVEVQTWVGRYFFKNRKDNLKALPFYLNAYFLNPDAYETEFVESRIRSINYEEATIRYHQLSQKDASLEEILKEPNPTVLVLALEQVNENWQPAYLKPVVSGLAHDDEQVRWLCSEAIQKHVDRSFDADLKVLLQDRDLRIRGLAAYVAAHVWKEQSLDLLRNMLNEEAQLLRFDAISSLSRDGGDEGRKILIAHRRRETIPGLQQMIDKAISRPPATQP